MQRESTAALLASTLVVAVGSAPATAATRTCRSVAAKPQPSLVKAVNMGCSKARRLVRNQTFNGRAGPGWVWINPAGCEGLIVRRRDRAYVVSHGYRLPRGAPAVRAVIYRGCRS